MPNKKLPLVFDAAVLEDPDEWLDDEHIMAAQHLLQEQHPDVTGLQSTSLQYTRTLDVHKDHPFVQCLHENGNHWITVSTVGCSSGVVQVFDSSHHLKLSCSLMPICRRHARIPLYWNPSRCTSNLGQVIVAFLLLQLPLQYPMW